MAVALTSLGGSAALAIGPMTPQASAATSQPQLAVNGNQISWPAQAGVTDFKGAINTASAGGTPTYQDLGNVTTWAPSAQPGQTLYYAVAAEGSGGEQWSARVPITWSANSAPALTVSGGKITWPAQAGATDFKAAVSTASTGGTPTYQDLGAVSSWSPTAQPGQTLYYSVASEGSAGEQWSARVSITWPAAANSVPVLTVSAGKITWSAQAGVTDFQGATSTAQTGGTSTQQDLGNVTSWTPTAQPGQTLYYSVASQGPAGAKWSARVAITWPAGPNSIPAVTVSGSKITWTAQPGATDFKGAINTAASGGTSTYQDLGNVTSWTPTAQPGQTLYYAVASEGPAGEQWANRVAISWPATQAPPPPPSPAPATGNTAPSLTLAGGKITWTGQSGATGFKGAISTAPAGSAGRTSTYQDLGNVTSWSPSQPCGQTLYYGVASEGPAGEQWSANEVTLTTAACAGTTGGTTTGTTGGSGALTTLVGWQGGYGGSEKLSLEQGKLQIDRIDTTLPVTPDQNWGVGVPTLVNIPGTCSSCGFGNNVSSIDPNAWASNALSYYQSYCHSNAQECPAIEVLNEPCGSWFWGSGADSQGNANAYAVLLKTVWTTFHNQYGSGAPKIIGYYVCYPGQLDWGRMWWNNSVGINMSQYVDGITVHPYGGPSRSGYTQAQSALGTRGDVITSHQETGKPVWLTELGWPTDVGSGDTADSYQWTQQQQADNIYSFMTWAKTRSWIGAATYFQYGDYSPNNWYGVVCIGEGGNCSDGTTKPGYTALVDAADNLPCSVCTIPSSTSAPTISGTPSVGQTLTANTGGWAKGPGSYSYEWERCPAGGGMCANNVATTPTYTLQAADHGYQMRVVVTASNGGSGGATGSSAPSALTTTVG